MVLALGDGWRLARGVVLLSVLVATAVVACAPDASAARRRHKSTSSHYSPPQASITVDGHSGKIIQSYKADELRFPASLTKVMTLYILFDFLKRGRVALDTELAVTDHAAAQSPTKLGLAVGDSIAVKDAIRALVTKSANDAAVAVAENLAGSEAAFAQIMTARARRMGMKNTTFRNASGLPNAEQTTTAYDLSVLARAILRDFPEHASVFQTRFFKYGKKLYKNHNGLLFNYAGVEGMKTGFTNASGFNLMTTARRQGKFVVSVVLGGRSSRQRNDSMRALLNAAWDRAKTKAEIEEERLIAQRVSPAKKLQIAAQTGLGVKPGAMAQSATARAREPVRATVTAASALASQPQNLAEKQAGSPPKSIARIVNEEAPSIKISASVDVAARPAALEVREPAAQPAAVQRPMASVTTREVATDFPGPYHVQVGAYESEATAQARLTAISREAGDILAGHPDFILPGVSGVGRSVSRARFGAFTQTGASNACEALRIRAIDCIIMPY